MFRFVLISLDENKPIWQEGVGTVVKVAGKHTNQPK